MLDLLNEAVRIFNELHALTDPFVDHDVVTASAIPTSSLVKSSLHFKLPTHSDMFEFLSSHGASSDMAEELASIHCEAACDLANTYTGIYDQAWEESLHSGYSSAQSQLSKLCSLLERKFHKVEDTWKQELLDSIRARQKKRRPAKSKPKRSTSFNHDFIPFLEAFFERTRRPTRADRLFLSRRSGMSLRQINVWFQNRRRRSNKSNLRTEQYDGSPTIAKDGNVYAEEDRNIAPRSDIDRIALKSEPGSSSRTSSVTLVDACLNSFERVPPPSAFPTPYPPHPDDYPFPCQHGDFSMPIPQWERRPTKELIERFTTANVEGVIDYFASLNLDDDADRRDERAVTCDVMAPYTVRPFPAPLPFLQDEDASTTASSPSSGPSTPNARAHAELSNPLPPVDPTETGAHVDWCALDLSLTDQFASNTSWDFSFLHTLDFANSHLQTHDTLPDKLTSLFLDAGLPPWILSY